MYLYAFWVAVRVCAYRSFGVIRLARQRVSIAECGCGNEKALQHVGV